MYDLVPLDSRSQQRRKVLPWDLATLPIKKNVLNIDGLVPLDFRSQQHRKVKPCDLVSLPIKHISQICITMYP